MADMRPMPALEVEQANAAYVWVRECQKDLRKLLQSKTALSGDSWNEIKWHWDRLANAVEMERVASAAAKIRGK